MARKDGETHWEADFSSGKALDSLNSMKLVPNEKKNEKSNFALIVFVVFVIWLVGSFLGLW